MLIPGIEMVDVAVILEVLEVTGEFVDLSY